MLFHVNIFFRLRLLFVLKASPLRAMRIGAGAIMFACLALPHLSHHDWRDSSTSSLEVRTHGMTFSPLSTLSPLVLVTIIVCAARFCRHASTMIFQIAVDPSFKSPSTILIAVTNLADVLGPVIFSSIFSNCYRQNQRYPTDTSFFLTLISCTSFLLYIGTLMLNIHFKGDFGTITDVTIRRSSRQENGVGFVDWLRLFSLTYITLLHDDVSLLLLPSNASSSGYNSRFSHLNMKEG